MRYYKELDPENLFFTSGATEGASLLLNKRKKVCALVEHPCVKYWCKKTLKVSKSGKIKIVDLTQSSVQLANSETGILQDLPKGLYMSDIVQAVGKIKIDVNNRIKLFTLMPKKNEIQKNRIISDIFLILFFKL